MHEHTTGRTDFMDHARTCDLFIDKTLFIKDFIESGVKVLAILRRKGFGKSTNLCLLESFFSLGANYANFEGNKITGESQSCHQHCRSYPVVSISFEAFSAKTWEEARQDIWLRVSSVVRKHLKELGGDLGQASSLDFNSNLVPNKFDDILKQLIQALDRKYNRKVIVLIDDYDTPLIRAHQMGYYKEASCFFGMLYGQALKDNSALQAACLMGTTGCILPSFNNVCLDTIIDEPFSKHFGFTTDEVKEYCGDELNNVRELYGGYKFGNHEIIKPSSFKNWFECEEFQPYSNVDSLSTLISTFDEEILTKVISPVFSQVSIEIKDFGIIDYEDEYQSESFLWNTLIHNGYLSFVPNSDDETTGVVTNPNLEIRKQRESFIQSRTPTNK